MPVKQTVKLDYFDIKAAMREGNKNKNEKVNKRSNSFMDDAEFLGKKEDEKISEITLIDRIEKLLESMGEINGKKYDLGGPGWRHVWSSSLYTLGNPRLKKLALSGFDVLKSETDTIATRSTHKDKYLPSISDRSQVTNEISTIHHPSLLKSSSVATNSDPLTSAVSFLPQLKQALLLKAIRKLESNLIIKSSKKQPQHGNGSMSLKSQSTVLSTTTEKYGKAQSEGCFASEVSHVLQRIACALDSPTLKFKVKDLIEVINYCNEINTLI